MTLFLALKMKYVGNENEEEALQHKELILMDKTLLVGGARISYCMWEVGGMNFLVVYCLNVDPCLHVSLGIIRLPLGNVDAKLLFVFEEIKLKKEEENFTSCMPTMEYTMIK